MEGLEPRGGKGEDSCVPFGRVVGFVGALVYARVEAGRIMRGRACARADRERDIVLVESREMVVVVVAVVVVAQGLFEPLFKVRLSR